MKRMVAAFMFSPEKDRVALIRFGKNPKRPAWMEGKWNAIGGKVEPFDRSARQAMCREFEEETGVLHVRWEHFATLQWHNDSGETVGEVLFYRAFSKAIDRVRTVEGEQVGVFPVKTLHDTVETFPNLRWLIPMALNEEVGRGMPYLIIEEGPNVHVG